MREMRGEVGKKTPKNEIDFYYVRGIKSGAKVVQIGLRLFMYVSVIDIFMFYNILDTTTG